VIQINFEKTNRAFLKISRQKNEVKNLSDQNISRYLFQIAPGSTVTGLAMALYETGGS
jgi:hypothetical protein